MVGIAQQLVKHGEVMVAIATRLVAVVQALVDINKTKQARALSLQPDDRCAISHSGVVVLVK